MGFVTLYLDNELWGSQMPRRIAESLAPVLSTLYGGSVTLQSEGRMLSLYRNGKRVSLYGS